MNVFRKCLQRHMGNNRYASYVNSCRDSFSKNGISQFAKMSKPIFDDMYEQLKKENKNNISERLLDMLGTLKTAFRITRYFALVFLAYLLGNIALLMLSLDYQVTCVSMVLMGVCFLYKVIEFVSNKYCAVDAYLFMIYKSALEKIAKETSVPLS